MTPPSPAPDGHPQPGAGSTPGPHWAIRASQDGGLTATLTGTHPPITISATDPATLRKNITDLTIRALL